MSREHVNAAAQSFLAASEAGDDTTKEQRALERALVDSGVEASEKKESFEVTWLSDIEEKEWEYLWYPWIPRGALVTAEGLPSVGKTFALLDLCARASSGAPWPCDIHATRRAPVNVAIMSAEDSAAKTLKKRLRMLGADMSRVAIIGDKTVRDPDTGEITSEDGSLQDVEAIGALLTAIKPAIFVVDTLSHFLGPKVNQNDDPEVKRVLKPIAFLAEQKDTAIVLVRHHNKSNTTNAVLRASGGIGITGQARFALCFGRHKDDKDRRALFCAKTNIVREPDPVEYRIDPDTGEFTWLDGETDMTMDDILGEVARPPRRTKQHDAGEWLEEFFSNGKMRRQDALIAASEVAGFKWKTLTRAAAEMGLVQKARHAKGRSGVDHYEWLTPELAAMEGAE